MHTLLTFFYYISTYLNGHYCQGALCKNTVFLCQAQARERYRIQNTHPFILNLSTLFTKTKYLVVSLGAKGRIQVCGHFFSTKCKISNLLLLCTVNIIDLGFFFEKSLSQVFGRTKLQKKDLAIYFFVLLRKVIAVLKN